MAVTDRRSFLRSLTTLVAAPAIVRASSLMAISPVPIGATPRFVVKIAVCRLEGLRYQAYYLAKVTPDQAGLLPVFDAEDYAVPMTDAKLRAI